MAGHVFTGELLNLLDLVGGPEAVEEMHEGNSGGQGGLGGDQGHILALLDVLGAEHAPAGLAGGHDVAMVAEDRESLAGDGAGGDMKDGGGQLAGDLVHVGDHQQQPLGGGEGGAQGAGGQRAVQGAGNAAFGLHLGDNRDGAPDVLLHGGDFGIRLGRHRRGWGDGVDGDDFAGGVGHMGAGLIAVDGDHFSGHGTNLLDCFDWNI